MIEGVCAVVVVVMSDGDGDERPDPIRSIVIVIRSQV